MSLDPLACAGFLMASLILAGIAQTAWLSSPVSARFALPLDGGLSLGGVRVFGANKTLRGFVVLVPATAAAFMGLSRLTGAGTATSGLWPLQSPGYAALGAAAGLGFMLGELPNSFVKRRLGIPPGAAPSNVGLRALCFFIDRLDSIVGMLLAVSLLVPTPWQVWAWVIALGPAIHWAFSVALYRLGVKERPA